MVAFPEPITAHQNAQGRASGNLTQALAAKRSKLRQCIDAQNVLMKSILSDNLPAEKKAPLVLAWDKLEDRIRILKGKPLPGVLKPGDRISRRKAIASPLSPYLHDSTPGVPPENK